MDLIITYDPSLQRCKIRMVKCISLNISAPKLIKRSSGQVWEVAEPAAVGADVEVDLNQPYNVDGIRGA